MRVLDKYFFVALICNVTLWSMNTEQSVNEQSLLSPRGKKKNSEKKITLDKPQIYLEEDPKSNLLEKDSKHVITIPEDQEQEKKEKNCCHKMSAHCSKVGEFCVKVNGYCCPTLFFVKLGAFLIGGTALATAIYLFFMIKGPSLPGK